MSARKPAGFSPYFTIEDANQVRAAFLAVGREERYASLSELIEAATLREVKRLQRKYNHSLPWPPALPGSARPGQRTTEETH